jgi:DnaJ like chaperone protein
MGWKGTIFGAIIGFLVTGRAWGAVIGAVAGFALDQSVSVRRGYRPSPGHSRAHAQTSPASATDTFFRTAFELMGHIAKSDGRVSEAEIGAARRMMHEFRLSPQEIAVAIGCFRIGKSSTFDAESAVAQLRAACGRRYDLLRAFMELEIRAALAGNGIAPPARRILVRVAENLGLSQVEYLQMEAAVRARFDTQSHGTKPRERPLEACYDELEVDAGMSDQEVTKAYRRQMSRHHPDKLVANGLPESMAQLAKERTQRIQEAYETIRAARGMR